MTAGSDGKIVVYVEEETTGHNMDFTMNDGQDATTPDGATAVTEKIPEAARSWKVIWEVEAAHGVYEVNHVCWARRCDRGKSSLSEEVVVSTGDDGEVKIWTLDD